MSKTLCECFVAAGIRKNAAKVLELLVRDGPQKSREIERACDLRQSDVSVALGELSQFVYKTAVKTNGRGRPYFVYELTVTPKHLFKMIIITEMEKVNQISLNIDALREILLEGSL